MDTVKIGDRVLPVVPQRHARLRRALTAQDFEKIMSKDYASEAYRILCVLIPALQDIPLWEWEGYGSQEAMDEDRYEESQDRSPTTAEIVDAFETALMVSGAGRLGKIVGLVESAAALTGQKTQTPTPPSLASSGVNGE